MIVSFESSVIGILIFENPVIGILIFEHPGIGRCPDFEDLVNGRFGIGEPLDFEIGGICNWESYR